MREDVTRFLPRISLMKSNIKALCLRLAAMTKHIFTRGNVTTTVLDLTEGLGGRTPEEILKLTEDGTIKEYRYVTRVLFPPNYFE